MFFVPHHATLVALWGLVAIANAAAAAQPDPALIRARDRLANSDDRADIEDAAVALCKDGSASSVALLADHLRRPAFWARLDKDDDYAFTHERLRIRTVLAALARVQTPASNAALLALVNDAGFAKHPARVDAWIDAFAEVRDPPDAMLELMDRFVVPGGQGTYRSIALRALAMSPSPDAVGLLDKRILGPGYDAVNKRAIFLGWFLTRRNDPVVVDAYERLLRAGIEEQAARDAAVATLFDYRPDAWFGERGVSHTPLPEPPDRAKASDAVLTQLLRIADVAERLELNAEVRDGLAKGKAEIAAILKARAEGKATGGVGNK